MVSLFEKYKGLPMKVERKVVTITEAAEMLAVSPLTIRRVIKNGKMKAMRMNLRGRYRIPIEELDSFISRSYK
jgi:excisionase family DNA binding protein